MINSNLEEKEGAIISGISLTKVNLELSPREEIAELVPSLSMIPNVVKYFLRTFYIQIKYLYLINLYFCLILATFASIVQHQKRLIHDFIIS